MGKRCGLCSVGETELALHQVGSKYPLARCRDSGMMYHLPQYENFESRACFWTNGVGERNVNRDRQVLIAVQFGTFIADTRLTALRIRSAEDTHRTNSSKTRLKAASRPKMCTT